MTTNILDLNKKFTLNLDKSGIKREDIPRMEVRLAIDKSGSMDYLFRKGFVDSVVGQFLGMAMSFDDDGSIEVGFFDTHFQQADDATAEDVGQYLMKTRVRANGGTAYAGIIRAFETERGNTSAPGKTEKKAGFFSRLFASKTVEAASGPNVANPAGCAVAGMRAYVAIVTDGQNFDQREFEDEMKRTSGEVFYQFISLGEGSHSNYLNGVTGKYKHASSITFKEATITQGHLTEDLMYENLCNQKFIDWLQVK